MARSVVCIAITVTFIFYIFYAIRLIRERKAPDASRIMALALSGWSLVNGLLMLGSMFYPELETVITNQSFFYFIGGIAVVFLSGSQVAKICWQKEETDKQPQIKATGNSKKKSNRK